MKLSFCIHRSVLLSYEEKKTKYPVIQSPAIALLSFPIEEIHSTVSQEEY